MEKPLTELEVQNIARAAGQVTLAECMSTKLVEQVRVTLLSEALVATAKDMGYNGSELLVACAFICINQLLVPHKQEDEPDAPRGYFNA